MTTQIRNIIKIDKDLCIGCGQCVLDCAEGAIAIVNGKAEVVSESYCDGLGACLQGCPTDALTIEQREAPPFDEEAAMAHAARIRGEQPKEHGGSSGAAVKDFAQDAAPAAQPFPMAFQKEEIPARGCPGAAVKVFPQADAPAPFPVGFSMARAPAGVQGGCPSSQMKEFSPAGKRFGTSPAAPAPGAGCRRLTWPVKLRLAPARAPFLAGAGIVLAADCAPAASNRFHELANGCVVLIACPKFEDNADITERLQRLFAQARPAQVTVMRMEVPCCRGLAAICLQAARAAGVPVREVVIGCDGQPRL